MVPGCGVVGQIHSALLVVHRAFRLWGRELPPGTPDSAYGFAILVETGGGGERREGGEGGGVDGHSDADVTELWLRLQSGGCGVFRGRAGRCGKE